MRLLHTADWHLGRLFHGLHLTGDQEAVLQGFLELVREVRPDAVLVAGDVYDRAVPPTDAVELLDAVLCELVLGLGVPVVAIAGNHDSGARLGFSSRLLGERGLHLVGRLPAQPAIVTLHDEHGPLHIAALPFADPAEARAVFGDKAIHDQAALCTAGAARCLAACPPDERRVLLGHAFVAGGTASESERPLTVGGAGSVPAAAFEGFDYVALGHLHRPQAAGPVARYAGSLLKYSFSECDHEKSACLVELGPPGAGRGARARVHTELLPLPAPRDVRVLQGTLDDLLSAGRTDPHRDDYILASLLDTGAVLDAVGRLRTVYPNTLKIERPALERESERRRVRPDPRKAGEAELFAGFHRHVRGHDASPELMAAFAAAVDGLRRDDREAGPAVAGPAQPADGAAS
jgi:exonuclease SbcD